MTDLILQCSCGAFRGVLADMTPSTGSPPKVLSAAERRDVERARDGG